MKKFIRTKDGIYELVDDTHIIKNNKLYEKEYFNNPFGDGSDEYIGEVLIGDILKQSDTIEELCDVYVSVYEEQLDNEIFWANKYTPMEVKNFYTGYIPKEVYGAIWTDKGLIYVAKLNDKGCLELL